MADDPTVGMDRNFTAARTNLIGNSGLWGEVEPPEKNVEESSWTDVVADWAIGGVNHLADEVGSLFEGEFFSASNFIYVDPRLDQLPKNFKIVYEGINFGAKGNAKDHNEEGVAVSCNYDDAFNDKLEIEGNWQESTGEYLVSVRIDSESGTELYDGGETKFTYNTTTQKWVMSADKLDGTMWKFCVPPAAVNNVLSALECYTSSNNWAPLKKIADSIKQQGTIPFPPGHEWVDKDCAKVPTKASDTALSIFVHSNWDAGI